MSKFNLLPPEVVKKRRHRRVSLYLMTAQIAVFLLAVLSIPALNGYEARLTERYAALDTSGTKYDASDRLAAEIARLKGIAETRDSVILSLDISSAEYIFLETANETVPESTALVSVEITPDRVEITGLTRDINVIESHRGALLNTGFWDDVTLGEITMKSDQYQYLLIGVMNG